jgi:hypothetical protein
LKLCLRRTPVTLQSVRAGCGRDFRSGSASSKAPCCAATELEDAGGALNRIRTRASARCAVCVRGASEAATGKTSGLRLGRRRWLGWSRGSAAGGEAHSGSFNLLCSQSLINLNPLARPDPCLAHSCSVLPRRKAHNSRSSSSKCPHTCPLRKAFRGTKHSAGGNLLAQPKPNLTSIMQPLHSKCYIIVQHLCGPALVNNAPHR